MGINSFFQSKFFRGAIFGVAAIMIFLLIFGLGVMVGEKKAGFSYNWGENYNRNFGGPRDGFFKNGAVDNFMGAHGVSGQIIKIDTAGGVTAGQSGTVVIKGRDNVEKIVIIKDDTVIRRLRDSIKITDLKVDDSIVVIGEANDAGQIEAKLVRFLPPLTARNKR